MDEDIDVDGDDDVLFGAQQFTEGDILATVSTEVTATPSPPGNPGVQVDIDVDDSITDLTEKSLRDLVAEGKVIKRPLGEASTSTQEVKKAMEEVMGLAEAEEVDALIELAKKASNPTALIKALEDKVKLLVCRSMPSPEGKADPPFCRNQLVFLRLRRSYVESV